MANVIKFLRGANLYPVTANGKIVVTESKIIIVLPKLQTQTEEVVEEDVTQKEVGLFKTNTDEDITNLITILMASGEDLRAGTKVNFSTDGENVDMNISLRFNGKKVYTAG